jgi:pyruvate/2-oxoglutarate dehydrogenase complex dihydrolipoamide dehydrogenase (E3) component
MASPTRTYDLVIIGAGTAGLTAATAARTLGARVALIEGRRTGGECTWTGCIPSKTLLAVAHRAHAARHDGQVGLSSAPVSVDFAAVMRHVRSTIERIYHEESPDALRRQDIDVFEAFTTFRDPHHVTLSDGRVLGGRRFLICTGAETIIPEAFRDLPCLTNESLFALDALPGHLVIVGGGPVGAEMAQAFARLGSQVTLVEAGQQLLPRDDAEAAALVAETFRAEGITVRLGQAAVRGESTPDGMILTLADGSAVTGTHVLLALGKRPHVDRLGLSAAGVHTQDGRLVLDAHMRTSQRHILAAGDVTGGPQFTHYAGWQAFQTVRSALLPFSAKATRAVVPWTTFTEPEVAQAGMTERAARERFGASAQVTRLPMSRADRAMTEGRPEGFMKLIHRPDGRLLGATLVGIHASEMINDWVRVLEKNGRVWDAASAMRVYPSMGTANVILATEQIQAQLNAGLLGRALRGLARFTLR